MQPLSSLRDPAPSRWSYRVQRWMLTPGIRLCLKVGLPGLFAAAIAGLVAVDDGRRQSIIDFADDIKSQIRDRPEFTVKVMTIDGAGSHLAEEVRAALPIDFPASSFDLDLTAMRDTILTLDPVRSASVRIRPGGVLQVDVIERVPAYVWRLRSGLSLVDDTGERIEPIDKRADRADLPLIAGVGANRAAPEAGRLLRAARPLGDRVRGLVRVGERRWDLVLDRGQRILLPVNNPVRALERIIALSEAHDMLGRDLTHVDMRIGARPTLRLTEDSAEVLWRIRDTSPDGQSR